MKLNNIFPNYETFKNDVIDKLNLLFPNVEWLNEQNSYMSFQTLYGLLSLYYGDRNIRYDNAQTFINKFTFDLADLLPDIYAKQQVFINNELKTYLSSAQNRAIKIQGGTTSKRQQNNNSKAANSITPANIVITNANELDRLPITSANLSDITLIDNINSSNEQTNFKYIDDLIKNLTSDYSLRLKEFMNLIKNHFTFIDTSNVKKECDDLYKGTRFRNGYYISNVDYLGVENQEQITLTNSKVQANKIEIEKLQSNIGSLNDYYKKYQVDSMIMELNNKDTIIKSIVDQNKIDIEQLNNNDNELWEYLENQYLVDNDLTGMKTLKANVANNTIEINNIKLEQTTQNNSIDNLNGMVKSNKNAINEFNTKVVYNIPITDRNRPYKNATLLPYTIDNRKVYQAAIKFGSTNGGEANLVNGSFHFFFDVTIINLDTKNLIDPKDWNLRYIPGEAIRGTLPSGGNFAFMCKVVEKK